MPDAVLLPPPPPARAAGPAVRVLLALIRGYQRTLSPLPTLFLGASCGCRFSPTCSHYAAEAVQVHGAWQGAWLTLRRLARCNPLHPGGLDPVPAPKSTRRECVAWEPKAARHSVAAPVS